MSFYADKSQQMAQAMGIFAQGVQQRKDRREQKMMQEIEYGLHILENDPEMADQVGMDLLRKYEDKAPWLRHQIDWHRKRALPAKEGGRAFGDLTAKVGQAEAQWKKQVESMPDFVTFPGMALPMPNQEKQQMQAEGFDQEKALAEALGSMPLGEQGFARGHATGAGIPLPEAAFFDPNKLPAGAYAQQYRDELKPGAQQTADIGAGLEVSPAAIAKQKTAAATATDLHKLKQEGRLELEKERAKRVKAPTAAQTAASKARILKKITASFSRMGRSKVVEHKTQKATIKETLGPDSDEYAAISSRGQKPMGPTTERILGRALAEMLENQELSEDSLDVAIEEYSSLYFRLMAKGKTEAQARRLLTKGSRAEMEEALGVSEPGVLQGGG